MSKASQPIYFQFEGREEIHQSHNWRLEIDVNLHRNRLGLPFWTRYKTLPDYEPDPNPEQDLTLATLSSNVGDSDLPTPVSKNPRKRKTKPKTDDVSAVQHILDNITPLDLVPEILRHKFDGSPNPFSNGMDERNNVEETK